ncbi:hypothetical protein [Terracidiphilus sp.]|jgi:hypothetical protein|uniref:hypothetical protein n=1 Tax=Terracidiphilus sp. TaxID=1964191 RepID=UPI003C22816F
MAASKWTLRILLAVVVLLIPASAHAANNCPWLTEATVGGLLGGDAVGAYTAGPAVTTSTSATITADAGPTVRMDQPGTCMFTSKGDGGVRELIVTMEVSTDAHAKLAGMMQACGASSQLLQAIGNEAAVCAMDAHKKSVSERVVGRVRNQIFTITIHSTVKDDPVLNTSSLMTRIYTASEQVAGNLF